MIKVQAITCFSVCVCVCPTNGMIIYELWRHIVCYGACLFIVHILFYQTCVTEWQITQAAAVVCQCQTIAWNRPCPLLLFFLIKWKFYLNASRIQIMLIYAVNSHPLINDQVRFVTVTHSLCWLNSWHINPNFHARLFLSLSFVAQMPTLLNHRSDSNVKIMDRNETTDVTRKYRALKWALKLNGIQDLD